MRVDDWLSHSVLKLTAANIPSARLDAMVLLEDVTSKDRAWLLAHTEQELTSMQVNKLTSFIERRAKHEPLAYIRGKSEFYGRTFAVTPATLQPRSETETMIELLAKLLNSQKPSLLGVKPLTESRNVILVDVGTGSGAIAITAKLEWSDATVYATEINNDALKIAKKNANILKTNIRFYQGNLLEPLSNFSYQISVILANLPYVPNSHTINKAAMQEPPIAIFGGEDGLDLYRELFMQISELNTKKSRYILTESLPFQHEALAAIAHEHGYTQKSEEDFIQVFAL